MTTASSTAARARAATTQRGRGRAQVSEMQTFTWIGIDKRGVKLKGEQISKNANLVKADLRKQGINPQVVTPKAKPLSEKQERKLADATSPYLVDSSQQ